MNEYDISDYSIFDNAISTNNTFKAKIEDLSSIIVECQKELSNDIFMGPISNICQETFSTLNTDIDSILTNISKVNTYFTSINEGYKSGDSNAASNIINLDNTEKENINTNTNINDNITTINETSNTNFSEEYSTQSNNFSNTQSSSIVNTSLNTSDTGYASNSGCGFNVTTGNTIYNLSDADKDMLYAIVSSESDGSPDDALAVATTILNRCDNPTWNSSYGNNPISQIAAPNQFEVYSRGLYKKYLNGNSSDAVKQAVNDALSGVRNHNYLSFRSNSSTGYSNNMISNTGNRYK